MTYFTWQERQGMTDEDMSIERVAAELEVFVGPLPRAHAALLAALRSSQPARPPAGPSPAAENRAGALGAAIEALIAAIDLLSDESYSGDKQAASAAFCLQALTELDVWDGRAHPVPPPWQFNVAGWYDAPLSGLPRRNKRYA